MLVCQQLSKKVALPAIIAWSPYGKNSGNADRFKALFGLLGLDQKRMSGLQKFEGPDPDFWCANGYAIVYPDPRGIGRSEGYSTMLGTQEGEDGHDLLFCNALYRSLLCFVVCYECVDSFLHWVSARTFALSIRKDRESYLVI